MASTTLKKDRFKNTTDGYIGVMTLDAKGDEKAIAVSPDGEVWLSEEEQILTANAPRDPANNPLVNGQLELIGSAGEVRNMRPLRPTDVADGEEETGAAPPPADDPEVGSRPAGEEVGTPEAARRRRPAKA